jgi:hypothetical protein
MRLNRIVYLTLHNKVKNNLSTPHWSHLVSTAINGKSNTPHTP